MKAKAKTKTTKLTMTNIKKKQKEKGKIIIEETEETLCYSSLVRARSTL